MDVVRHEDPPEFRARTEPFLMADEARHSLLLGLTSTLIERPEVYADFHLWVLEDGGEVAAAAAILTPPFNLALSRSGVDGAIRVLAERLHRDGVSLPGVTGALPEVDLFAEAWTERTGDTAGLAMAMRIHRLTAVKPVDGVPGHMRDARPSDRDLLVGWIRAFGDEALPNDDHMDPERVVDLRLQEGTGAGWSCGRTVIRSPWRVSAGPPPTGSASAPSTRHRPVCASRNYRFDETASG